MQVRPTIEGFGSDIVEVSALAPEGYNGVQKKYELNQNYPNPFNPTTVISYQLASSSEVSLKVYDEVGRELKTLVIGKQPSGTYAVTFDATNVASGVYFYRLETSSGFNQSHKMLFLK